MTMTPQKRPLVLLYKSTECATFSVAPISIAKQQIDRSIDSIQDRFPRMRLNSAPPTIAENSCLGNSLDDNSVFDEEDETKIDQSNREQGQINNSTTADDNSSSGTSGHSSLEDSPISRSDSPSPITPRDTPSSKSATTKCDSTNGQQLLAGRLSKALRHRSVSECEGISSSPVKGILKSRLAVVRSMSECAEGENGIGGECLSSNDAIFAAYVSESGDDDNEFVSNIVNDQSPTFKKTVRFNDRVQQTLFRPNSSILGHKKKQERKQNQQQAKSKRKRTNSNSSVGSDSRISFGEIERDAAEFDSTRRIDEKKSTSTDDHDRRRHQNRTTSLDESRQRYVGFLIGRQPIVKSDQRKQQQHLRHLSGDSALGDDESDNVDIGSPVVETPARISNSDTKDSGIDEEF